MKLNLDFKEVLDFGERITSFYEFETAIMAATRAIARVLHQHLLNNTPVKTGNLRKMWSAGDNLLFTVERVNGGYQVTFINSARRANGFKYGIAVNDGHNSLYGTGWVIGKLFVERSILMTENSATLERLIYSELEKWFGWCVNG